MKLRLVLKATNEIKEIEVEDMFDSIDIAKDMVREALKNGVKNPKVRIMTYYGSRATDVWTIITKTDVREKIYQAATLTDFELDTLKKIVKNYIESGVDNTDYYNTFGFNDKSRKGAVASLIRKQVVIVNRDPGCFNPIFPDINLKSTCEKYGIEVPTNI